MKTRFWLYIVLHALLFMAGVFCVSTASVVIQSIGASLIAAGVAGWVIFLYLFVSSAAAERVALIEAAGLRAIFPRRSISIRQQYEERVRNAREGIDVIGYGLRALREDLGGEFGAWAERAIVRILLVDPDFPATTTSIADLRDAEEGDAPGKIRQEVREFVLQCADLLNRNARFRIRLYRAIPAINYFRVDDEAFWGPFFVGQKSRNTPAFLVARSGFLFGTLLDHFEKLWTSEQLSRDVPPEWLERK